MVPGDAASSPGFPFYSPKPRQVTKLAVAGHSGSRSAPQSPHTPTNLGQQPLGPTTLNPDGSLSVIRNDDDANNSGLLDLSPALTRVIKSRPNNFASSPSAKRQRTAPAKSRLSNHATFQDAVLSSQPTEDYLHSDPLAANGLPAEEADGDDLLEDDQSSSSTTLNRLRRWRQDAMQQHLYDTAIFWGTKAMSLETSAAAFNDAYHLAQCYFYTHQYARAEQLLTTPLRNGRSTATNHDSTSYSAKHTGAEGFLASDNVQEDDDALQEVLQQTRSSSILPVCIMARSTTKDSMYSATSSTTGKRKKRDFNVTATGTGSSETDSSGGRDQSDDEFLEGASHDAHHNGSVIFRDVSGPQHPQAEKKLAKGKESIDLQADVDEVKNSSLAPAHGPVLVNHSLACRYLAAQCQVRLAKYHEALDLLGETEHWGSSASNKRPSNDGGIKLGSSVAYLRGQIHLRLEDLPRARDSFMAALALDVKNYEAFSALIDGEMLGTEEQWNFVQSLEYAAQAGDEPGALDDYELVRLLYTTQLSKQGKALVETTSLARRRLADEYGLADDPDVLHGLAAELFSRLRFADAFVVTSRISELSADHPATLPIHIACTYHLKNLRPALFMLAHRLTELQPESPVSWYAVGTWYATTRRWAEARRYFSKASLLDPRFAPGWIAFGHTFALEGESDQAIIAYSTAARLFPQSHLPKLFVGMEHLHQDNLSLARLSLEGSAAIWPNDPLLANERGIVAFQTGDLDSAATFFSTAIDLARDTQHPASSWKACYLNLGIALMRVEREEKAKSAFQSVVELDPHNYQAHLCLGMLAHKEDELDDAIQHYHEALSINPRDAYATELLDFVLEEKVHYGVAQFAKYDPQGRLFNKGGKGSSQGSSMMDAAAGKGKQRQVESSARHPSAAGRLHLASIPEASSPSPAPYAARQQQEQESFADRSTASSHPTQTSIGYQTPVRTAAMANAADVSTASATEMSLDNSASLPDASQSQSQTQAEFQDQSSVLMDESMS
ncbi:related to anaphase control protein cut9 [Ustilago bromivora]|uniref:Related to anaphase control protein cut9 n=1 Tax=Ustilago bromivora TaxID=307758 RepID=A0A1K0G9Z7_9BASI|nr:related to anaphase control protein cut9 [Ustilago bromivora]SYW80267.1 related to anaphase control protein cut9 [Ustilago bromivora]